MRRGAIGLSLHTMLALITGIILFSLLVVFATNIMQQGKQDQVRALSYRLENEFLFSGTEHDLYKELEVPTKGFKVVCSLDEQGRVQDAHLRVGSSSYSTGTLSYLPVFAHEKIKGPQLDVWGRSWQAPMTVGSFLYVADRSTRIVIVTQNQAWVDRIVKKLDPFRISVITPGALSTFSSTGDDQYRFILFAGDPGLIPRRFRGDSSFLLVTTKNKGVSGTLSFHDDIASTVPTLKTEYYGEAMLLAAIFSGDAYNYHCNMAKASNMLDVTIRVLEEKAVLLATETGNGLIEEDCANYYAQARVFLAEYARLGTLALREDSETVGQLERLNAALESRGCPALW